MVGQDIDELLNLNQEESDLAALLIAGPNQEGRDHLVVEAETLLRTIDGLRAQVARLETANAWKDAALREAARLYHEAKHFILGEVDRKRFPSYLECPYWPCVDFRAAISGTGAK